MQASEHRPRQREARGIAGERLLLDLRAAGIAEPEQLRGLVEGFADGVVDGGAEPHVVADAEHRDDLGVPAGGEEQAIGKRRAVGEPRGERVRLEMIDRDQRLLADQRDRLGGGEADDHAADQSRSGGGGDAVEVGEAALPASAIALAMIMSSASTWARAAISGTTPPKAACSLICESTTLDRILPGPAVGPLDHRRRGFVAGRLDAEHDHGRFHSARTSAVADRIRCTRVVDNVPSPTSVTASNAGAPARRKAADFAGAPSGLPCSGRHRPA